MRSLARPARSALKASSYYAGGLFKRLTTNPVFLWAQAIAFKVLVTLLPLVILATGIFGLVLRQENPFETVSGFIRSFLPEAQSGPLIELVFQLQRSSGALTFVGAAAFLFTVITLFTTLRYVIGQAMGVTRHQVRSIPMGYVFDVRMIVQVGTLFLLSFGVTFGAKLLYAQSGALATEIGMDPALVDQIGGAAVRLIVLTVPYLLTFGMIAQLYYFIPRPHPPKRSAALGAAVAAVLFELAKNGFAVYASTIGNFDRYEEGNDALGGVFGLIIALVIWVYISGLVLIIGAFVTRLHENRMAPRRQSAVRRLWKRMGSDRRRARLAAMDPDSSTDPPEATGDGLAGPLSASPTPTESDSSSSG
ncbi:MAG: YihY/virulence factor BrkB family protein [Rubricoccaceae bacterium]